MSERLSERPIPDALLERYLSDDLGPEAKARVEQALLQDSGTKQRLDSLRQERSAFLAANPAAPFAHRVSTSVALRDERARPWWQRAWGRRGRAWLVPSLATAFVALFTVNLLRLYRSGAPAPGEATRPETLEEVARQITQPVHEVPSAAPSPARAPPPAQPSGQATSESRYAAPPPDQPAPKRADKASFEREGPHVEHAQKQKRRRAEKDDTKRPKDELPQNELVDARGVGTAGAIGETKNKGGRGYAEPPPATVVVTADRSRDNASVGGDQELRRGQEGKKREVEKPTAQTAKEESRDADAFAAKTQAKPSAEPPPAQQAPKSRAAADAAPNAPPAVSPVAPPVASTPNTAAPARATAETAMAPAMGNEASERVPAKAPRQLSVVFDFGPEAGRVSLGAGGNARKVLRTAALKLRVAAPEDGFVAVLALTPDGRVRTLVSQRRIGAGLADLGSVAATPGERLFVLFASERMAMDAIASDASKRQKAGETVEYLAFSGSQSTLLLLAP